MDNNEYPKDHPKWYGVPAKGEVPPVNQDILIFGIILIVFEALLGFFLVETTFQLIIISIAIIITTLTFIIWLVLWRGKPFVNPRYPFVIQIFFIIILEICIWAVYRSLTADFVGEFGTMRFYGFHIIAAPTIHLIPILIYWRYIREERGLPFVFTRKLILSGLLVGFTAAIIWRVLQELVYAGLAASAGGTDPGTFTFYNLLESPLLFSTMTFVMFFIVGPVEELEFRSFTQDQAARVLPNWQALIFSSVLFGCSHIPIAVFVYQFEPLYFGIALTGWISAGVVFGALYMWSRNIFACIIMHGMGNWQLSVFYFQFDLRGGWIMSSGWVAVELATIFIVDATLIILFYLIHKHYWEPHRRGEPAFGGAFQRFQSWMYDHDFGRASLGKTSMVVVLFCVLVCGILMGAAVSMGTVPPPPPAVGSDQIAINLEEMVEFEEVRSETNKNLGEGHTEVIDLASAPLMYIKEVSVIVKWTDEADRGIGYQNTPDEFSVTISGLNVTPAHAVSANSQGGQGSVSTTFTLTFMDIENAIASIGEEYNVTVKIKLENAGDQERFGFLNWIDDSNAYDYDITINWLIPPVEDTNPTTG